MTFPTLTAAEFMDAWPRIWSQGEHVALCGPTGSGKTVWLEYLVQPRKWVVFMASKPKDPTMDALRRRGWKLARTWPPPNELARRVIFWPKLSGLRGQAAQKRAFVSMLEQTFNTGGWTVIADDLQYLSSHLGLRHIFAAYWLQARSIGVSLVASTQRPRHVPVECWANSSHFFIWQTANGDDLKQLGNISGADALHVRKTVASLPRWHVLYVPAREQDLSPIIVDLRGLA